MKRKFGDLHFNEETSKTPWVSKTHDKIHSGEATFSCPGYMVSTLSFPSSHLPVHSGKQHNAWG